MYLLSVFSLCIVDGNQLPEVKTPNTLSGYILINLTYCFN